MLSVHPAELLEVTQNRPRRLRKGVEVYMYIYIYIYIYIIYIYLFTAIGLSPGGSRYSTCIRNVKLVTTIFKSGGLHEKHVVATGNVENRLSICL